MRSITLFGFIFWFVWYGWRRAFCRHAWGYSTEGWLTIWAGPLRVCVARGLSC